MAGEAMAKNVWISWRSTVICTVAAEGSTSGMELSLADGSGSFALAADLSQAVDHLTPKPH
jgi:hypothetical protein